MRAGYVKKVDNYFPGNRKRSVLKLILKPEEVCYIDISGSRQRK